MVTSSLGEVHQLTGDPIIETIEEEGIGPVMAHPDGGFWLAQAAWWPKAAKMSVRYRVSPAGEVTEDAKYQEFPEGGYGRVIGMGEYGQLYSIVIGVGDMVGAGVADVYSFHPTITPRLEFAGFGKACRSPGVDLYLALPVAPAEEQLDAP